jgi:hypothetical protein
MSGCGVSRRPSLRGCWWRRRKMRSRRREGRRARRARTGRVLASQGSALATASWRGRQY